MMPQRTPEDGKINWNWDPLRIYNFIRAQTNPYPGAFSFLRGEKVIVWEAKLFDYLPKVHNRHGNAPGQIIDIVDQGSLQGLLVWTANGDHPLLLTTLGCEEVHSRKKNN